MIKIAHAFIGFTSLLVFTSQAWGQATHRILSTPTDFSVADKNNGIWTTADFDNDGKADLCFIKTQNTASKKIEVHISSAASNFQKRIISCPTAFIVSDRDNGTWQMVDYDGDGKADLCFIKTKNTASRKIEIHIASAASNFQKKILSVATNFSAADGNNGTFTMAKFDRAGKPVLCFIKTKNTSSKKIEVHIASVTANNNQARILETPTTFDLKDCDNGTWTMTDFDGDGRADLCFIKTKNTTSKKIEVHIASGAAPNSYQSRMLETASTFALEDKNNGTWTMAKFGVCALYFIKVNAVNSNSIEVHIEDVKQSK